MSDQKGIHLFTILLCQTCNLTTIGNSYNNVKFFISPDPHQETGQASDTHEEPQTRPKPCAPVVSVYKKSDLPLKCHQNLCELDKMMRLTHTRCGHGKWSLKNLSHWQYSTGKI